MPRRITIFLAAPPGDGLRAAREHFHEYVKPVLVAGALDWEVIEGRREGEVRAGLAEKIRKLRKRKGERLHVESSEEDPADESQEQLLYELRQKVGIKEWDGVQGDLILGRHTWKEYMRGLHEGWLGPLNQPQQPTPQLEKDSSSLDTPSDLSLADTPADDSLLDSPPPAESTAPTDPPAKKPKPAPALPYISPAEYSSCSLSPVLDASLNPSLPLPLPHLLGFLNTPTRLYRFLTRRRLADSTGRSVAALVLASHSRAYNQSAEYASAIDPDDNSPSAATMPEADVIVMAKETWEQEAVLKEEEHDWHKSAWKPNAEGEEQERVWQESVVVDSRIGERMRKFELSSSDDEKAEVLDAQRRREAEGVVQKARKWVGWTEEGRKGWDMGLEGDEND